MSRLVDYYLNEGPDSEGRILEDTLYFSDEEYETTHDFIQWTFPLKEPSKFNPDAPILSEEDIILFRANPEIQSSLLDSFERFLEFLGLALYNDENRYTITKAENFDSRKALWMNPNHNWLRISRVLTSIRILGMEEQAQAFFQFLEKGHKEEGLASEESFKFWSEAAKISEPVEPPATP